MHVNRRLEVVDGALLRISGPDDGPTLFLLPGFPDNGQMFEPLNAYSLAKHYRLVAIDLWGFGASPRRNDAGTIDEYADALVRLIERFAPTQTVGLVGHSIAAVIWSKVSMKLGDQISGLFSIEGNLTPDDAFFTGKAMDFDDPHEFKRCFLEQVWQLGLTSLAHRRYFAGAVSADPVAMWNLGRDAKRISVNGEPGASYKRLAQPTLYYWSLESTPPATAEWIEKSAINNQVYSGAGHWPTIEQPEATARAISLFFNGAFEEN